MINKKIVNNSKSLTKINQLSMKNLFYSSSVIRPHLRSTSLPTSHPDEKKCSSILDKEKSGRKQDLNCPIHDGQRGCLRDDFYHPVNICGGQENEQPGFHRQDCSM